MTTITKEEFNIMVEESKLENKILILKFEAEWCGPCRALSITLEKIAEENPEIQIVKVNVDENSELSTEFSIRSIPAVFIYKNGEQIAKFAGVRSKEDILKLI